MTANFNKIHQIIENSMKQNNIPGAALAIINDHQIILSKGYGKTNVEEWGSAVLPSTLFRIASVSKLFTGTVMMMLVEKGLIELDKRVQHYIPWFTTANQEFASMMTVRMLLTHTSGLPTGDDEIYHYEKDGLFRYMKEVVPTLPVLFYPGTAYSYGNHALNIAGFIAEQVTGKPFSAIMQELLFSPLQMNSTTYDPLKAMTFPLALPHESAEAGDKKISHQFFDQTASYPSYYSFSSVEDLCKFAMFHLQGGQVNGHSLLLKSSIEEMRKKQSDWFTLTDGGCGITFFQEKKDGIQRFWHYGQYSSQYSSQFILVPEKGIAVIALANGENIFQAGYEIVDELLKEEKINSQHAVPSIQLEDVPEWEAYRGSYLHKNLGIISIDLVDEKPLITIKNEPYELVQYSNEIFTANDVSGTPIHTVGFPSRPAEVPDPFLVVNTQMCPAFIDNYERNPLDWKEWEGVYSNGQEFFHVIIGDDSLVITEKPSNHAFAAKAIRKNQFLFENGFVRFININGTIVLEFDNAWRYKKID
ncbi:serine hydrolase domain-containing protein [Bacillus salacetis]|uniref:serine hydrolase domain-containing protein n=1 Tax=Bacillus salacetis TaxID=2315464 RepID=UPI003BA0405E